MSLLIIGLILFFATHSISIVNASWRNRVAARIGTLSWQGLYSMAALAGLLLIIWGYGLARQDPVILYLPPAWLRHGAMLLLIFMFPLLLATYLPGRIQTVTKHPMLVATKLWALAHLLANGNLADVLLFGSFLTWAVIDRISLKRRPVQVVPALPTSRINDALAIVLGLALYVVFVFWGHGWLIGVPLVG
ncbi:MAG TPA: NnrU family protein [Gammaproteobacteria bacterium]|nr:NnrU family protein [Gammaproteobacteria bacterium]